MEEKTKRIIKGVAIILAGAVSYKILNGKSVEKSVKETIATPKKILESSIKEVKKIVPTPKKRKTKKKKSKK